MKSSRFLVLSSLTCALVLPGLSPASAGEGPATISVVTDSDRNGRTDEKDAAGQGNAPGKAERAFLIPNVDDDDSDNRIDASDDMVNGVADAIDLARIKLSLGGTVQASDQIKISVTKGAGKVRLFQSSGEPEPKWELVRDTVRPAAQELGIEATEFASKDWDGVVSLTFEVVRSGAVVASQTTEMQVAPWIMLPNSANTKTVYMQLDKRTDDTLHRQMTPLVRKAVGTPIHTYKGDAGSNPDQWTQDTMEIGYTQLPGHDPMHVVMKAQRGPGKDKLGRTLLAPDFGFISIGSPRRNLSPEDGWMDWTGNLEVSGPVPGYPLGRIYYGKSKETTFHPEIVAFLKAQGVQAPFAVDTSWLTIQHVDEIFNFVPDKQGNTKMIVVSPRLAHKVEGTKSYSPYNRKIQKILDRIVRNAKKKLNLGDGDIVELPVSYAGSGSNAHTVSSDPVNSIYVNGTAIVGRSGVTPAARREIGDRFDTLGIKVAWVDDAAYQTGGGNVHCGTNTAKVPLYEDFTDALPGLESGEKVA